MVVGGNQNDIGVDGCFVFVFVQLIGDFGFVCFGFNSLNSCIYDEFQILFLQQFLELFLDIGIYVWGDLIKEFDNGYFGVQVLIN